MAEEQDDGHNGLRRALDTRIVNSLGELSELKGEFRASLQAINEKIDQLLTLQGQVQKNTLAIARLKMVASSLAAGVAFGVSFLKSWLFRVE